VQVQFKKDIKHQGVLQCLHQKLKDHEPGHPDQESHKNNKRVFPFISLPVLHLLCAFSKLIQFTWRTRLLRKNEILMQVYG